MFWSRNKNLNFDYALPTSKYTLHIRRYFMLSVGKDGISEHFLKNAFDF